MTDETYVHMTAPQRLGVLWRTAWPLIVLSLLLWAVAIHADAWWPHQWATPTRTYTPEQIAAIKARTAPHDAGWDNFFLFYWISWFLAFKCSAMARQMTYRDWVALSIIATNLAFVGLYQLVINGILFPAWFAERLHEVDVIQTTLRFAIVVSAAAAAILIALNIEQDRVRWRWMHDRVGPLLVVASAALVLAAWVTR